MLRKKRSHHNEKPATTTESLHEATKAQCSQNKYIHKIIKKKKLQRTHGKILTPVNSWWWVFGYQVYSFLCVIVKLGNDAGDAGQRDGEPFLVLTSTVKYTDIFFFSSSLNHFNI